MNFNPEVWNMLIIEEVYPSYYTCELLFNQFLTKVKIG